MTQCACGNCQYFDQHVTQQALQEDAGLCRFNPPISQPGPEAHGLWPVVDSSDWCGHFAARVERFISPPNA
jgi:hypothetical protein